MMLDGRKFWLVIILCWIHGPSMSHCSGSLRDEVSDFFGNEKNTITGPIIPLCRRGHAQATAAYIDRRNGEKKRGVFIFGGYTGLNYEFAAEPGSAFLQDLWIVDLWISNKTVTDSNGDMGYKHSFKRVSMQTTSSTTGWPDQRWQMGSTATEEGWFMLYGGEDSYRGIFFDDTWVFLERRWLPISLFNEADLRHAPIVIGTGPSVQTSSNSDSDKRSPGPINGGNGINNPIGGGSGSGGSGSGGAGSGEARKSPGRRKSASLVLLPASGLVVLFGGIRAKTNSRTSSNIQTGSSSDSDSSSSVSSGHKNYGLTAVNGSSGGRGRGSGTSSSSSSMVYLCDIYVVNATAAVRKAAQLHNITVGTVGSRGAAAAIGLEELQSGGWKRGHELPGPCVSGASVVGIVDPHDGREKLFLFGGKHTTEKSSSSAHRRRTSSSSSVSGQTDDNGPDSISGSSDEEQLVLSSAIWMYDVASDSWAKEVAPAVPISSEPPAIADTATGASLLWPQARDKHSAVYSATLKTVFVSGGRLASATSSSGASASTSPPMRSFRSSGNSSSGSHGNGGGLDEEDAALLDLWGFSLVTRRWALYGRRKRDGSVGTGSGNNVVSKPLSGDATTAYSSVSPSPSPVVVASKNATPTAIPPQGSTSGSSVVHDDYVDDDDYNMDDYMRNSKWWVGPHSSVAGGSQQVDKRPASRFSFGLSAFFLGPSSTLDGTANVADSTSSSSIQHRELLVMFGGERSDTPWQQQSQQTLVSAGRSTETSTSATMVEEEEDGLVFEQVLTVQTLGQSNDLWIFRLPLGTTTIVSTTTTVETADKLHQSDQEQLSLSSNSDGGDLDRRYHASHSSSPSHPPTHRPTLAPAQAVGWLILSAGGCHSGDDGSVYESAVNTSAVLVAVMIGFATVGGLTAYQILKYRDNTDQQHLQNIRNPPPFSNGSSIGMTSLPSNALNSSRPLGSSSTSDDDITSSRHQPTGLDGVPLSPYQLLRNYQQPDPSPTSARQPSRTTSASAIQYPSRPGSAPLPSQNGLTSPTTTPSPALPSAPSSGLGLGLLASLRGYEPLTADTAGDGL